MSATLGTVGLEVDDDDAMPAAGAAAPSSTAASGDGTSSGSSQRGRQRWAVVAAAGGGQLLTAARLEDSGGDSAVLHVTVCAGGDESWQGSVAVAAMAEKLAPSADEVMSHIRGAFQLEGATEAAAAVLRGGAVPEPRHDAAEYVFELRSRGRPRLSWSTRLPGAGGKQLYEVGRMDVQPVTEPAPGAAGANMVLWALRSTIAAIHNAETELQELTQQDAELARQYAAAERAARRQAASAQATHQRRLQVFRQLCENKRERKEQLEEEVATLQQTGGLPSASMAGASPAGEGGASALLAGTYVSPVKQAVVPQARIGVEVAARSKVRSALYYSSSSESDEGEDGDGDSRMGRKRPALSRRTSARSAAKRAPEEGERGNRGGSGGGCAAAAADDAAAAGASSSSALPAARASRKRKQQDDLADLDGRMLDDLDGPRPVKSGRLRPARRNRAAPPAASRTASAAERAELKRLGLARLASAQPSSAAADAPMPSQEYEAPENSQTSIATDATTHLSPRSGKRRRGRRVRSRTPDEEDLLGDL